MDPHRMIEEPPVVFHLQDGPRRAYARICLWPDPLGWVLTDISVPFDEQARGYGSNLLQQVADFADAQSIDITLEPQPAGGWMDVEDLIAWYGRWGFRYDEEGLLRRKPKEGYA